MNWQECMRQNARNWLTKGDATVRLDTNFLMLLGNPDLFQADACSALFSDLQPAGVFLRGQHEGRPVSYCRPIFSAAKLAMYLEVIAMLGVRNVVACGYVGGIGDHEIGSYIVPDSAGSWDGCTRAYFPYRASFSSSKTLRERVCRSLEAKHSKFYTGPVASIDAIMLETDEMIADFAKQGFCALDLETACLFGVGERLGLNVAAVHIVSDSPSRKLIDPERYHEAAFSDQLEAALDALAG